VRKVRNSDHPLTSVLNNYATLNTNQLSFTVTVSLTHQRISLLLCSVIGSLSTAST